RQTLMRLKNKKGRVILLPPITIEALRAQAEQQERWRLICGPEWRNEKGLVFTRRNGSPIHPDAFTHEFARITRAAGLVGLTPKSLRHTHATMLLAANQHPKKVSERLGHSQVGITLETYSHILPTMQEELARATEEMLAPVARPFVEETKRPDLLAKPVATPRKTPVSNQRPKPGSQATQEL
ncbi:MAG: tyrosine-type recombinase/integrase, partial [Desulfotomaculales bacterium]